MPAARPGPALILLFLAVLAPAPARAGPPDCTCTATFDAVVEATQTNYAGVALKFPDARARADLGRATALLRTQATAAPAAGCGQVLDRYTALFADHHLFAVLQEGPAPALARDDRPWSASRIRRALRADGDGPLAGRWYDQAGPVAVVRDDRLPARTWAAVRHGGEQAGTAIAYFTEDGTGHRATYRHPQHGWQRAPVGLHRESDLLVFGLQALGRQGASRLHPADPLRPHLLIEDGEPPYLSLPSFLPQHRQALSDLLRTHARTLAEARTLVVDVRGNAGGDAIYFELGPILLDGEIRIAMATSALASPWTIQALADMRERQGEAGAWLDEPLRRMRAAPGQVVPFAPERRAALPATAPRPLRIALLQDRGVGSAAEAFIVQVSQSGKVTTLGEASRGNLDYMQVSMRPVGCGDAAAWFGYPLYFRTGLPDDPIDRGGLAPDLPLPADLDWVDFARAWLQAP